MNDKEQSQCHEDDRINKNDLGTCGLAVILFPELLDRQEITNDFSKACDKEHDAKKDADNAGRDLGQRYKEESCDYRKDTADITW